jgi:predicted amidohydrolase
MDKTRVMKIALAQTRPVRGDIESNITKHIHLINRAAKQESNIIIFPELSLTSYEPSLAKRLATDEQDTRFAIFQQLSDENQLIIGVGVPTKSNEGIQISMVLFQPGQPPQVNSKMYLHPDEDPFFVPGNNLPALVINNTHIALAICYEISVPQHAEIANSNGAQLYIASVAKTTKGVEKAVVRLSEIASEYGMTVLMSNSIGLCEDGECGGMSSVWNNRGDLVGQLNDTDEGLLLFDTTTQLSTAIIA